MRHRGVLLLGLKHSGKSSVGQLTATQLGWQFLDLDLLCVAEQARRNGTEQAPADIYREHGARYWRRLETVAAGQLVEQCHNQSMVAALGGGTMTNRSAMRVLTGVGLFVYLQADCQLLYNRFMRFGTPAFLDTADPYAVWMRLCARRAVLCGRYADITIVSGQHAIQELSAQLIAQVEQYVG